MRSTRPVRGGGSASATTISSWSALATTTRSVGSVSSAVRRNTVRRSPRRTMRASVSARPDRSPTRPTSSPTTIEVRPNSRARMAVTTRSGSRPSAQPHRPRSTVTTMPSWASAWSGRVLVRGREPRPGRIRTSDSSYLSPSCSGPRSFLAAILTRARLRGSTSAPGSAWRQHVGPHPRKIRQCLGGGADVFHLDAGHPQPDDRTGRRHPVVGVGPPQAAVQRAAR